MKFPTIELQGRKVILLSGVRTDKRTGETVFLASRDKLLDAFSHNPDAVAFGFTSGRWVAAA